jgi:peptide/nickel transport system ATP-binding protein
MLLEFNNVTIKAGRGAAGFKIVDDVSFSLSRGEVLGLIGESGAGKSTLGLAALGYLRSGCRLAGGSVVLAGTDMFAVDQKSVRALRGNRIAYVAQSAAASFTPTSTLESQIIDVPVRRGTMSRQEAVSAMVTLFKTLQLPDPERFGKKYPHQASGGQLQRAMLAMAMIGKPDILVFDEPTTALDVSTQLGFLLSVRALIADHGIAGLYITHDLATIAQLADRVLVLRNGKTVETGDAAQVLFSPAAPYTRELVSAQTRSHEPPSVPAGRPGTILDVRGISASYDGTTPILNDVSMSLAAGQALAIVGESGSGKSTLARVIMGLLKPTGGEVVYQGNGLDTYDRRSMDERKNVQLINQSPDWALNPRETVEKAIERPLQVFARLSGRAMSARVDELLSMVGLSPKLRARYPNQISGGEKQRVCIARALAAEPEILICDEVTSSLDTIVADGILMLLRDLKERLSTSLVVITHDFHVVSALADGVVVLRNGVVQETGPAADIMANPSSPYVRRLLAAVPEMRVDWLDEVAAEQARVPAGGA